MKTSLTINLPKSLSLIVSVVCIVLGINTATAQRTDDIVDTFINYTNPAREVIYLHLNKSTYIKGESIGFTAYILDKTIKRPALLTTNLYVSIEDMSQTPLKQQLLKVENGIASNIIEIDDAFASGTYLVKAYTNWSRNFKEPNYFISSIRIIDPETETYVETESVETAVDAQFLPESGHLLAGITNKVGVVIKDTKGFGLSNATGEVFDKAGHLLTSFRTNALGIGQFILKPELGDNYNIVITHNYKDYNFKLNQKIESTGLVLSTSQRNDQLLLNIHTNEASLKFFKTQYFKLGFHNGAELQIETINFKNKATINRTFDIKQLPPGITIFTLFNSQNKPIAERMFFNYHGLNIKKSTNVQTAMVANDSVDVSLSFADIDPAKYHNISISVLPQDTKSYGHHHNLISYNYLQPYVRGHIEQARYYFTDVDKTTMAHLDMLLLTQGWSSYNWNSIFNNTNRLPFDFENGLSLKATINSNKQLSSKYMVHAIKDKAPVIFELSEAQKTFQLDNAFVSDTDPIMVSLIDRNEDLRPASLYLQSSPSYVPKMSLNFKPLDLATDYLNTTNLKDNVMATKTLDELQNLDEVVITKELEKNRTRIRELTKNSYGTVGIVTESDTYSYYYLEDYLRFKFRIESRRDSTGATLFFNPRGGTGGPMQIFLDDFPLNDPEILRQLPLYQIDYVDVNYSGLGEGFRGNNGALRIYQSNKSSFNRANNPNSKVYTLPLTFESEKTYYTPIYQYQSDDFYKQFGVVTWQPKLSVNQYGITSFKIEKPLLPITLFIEGIDSEGNPIYEEKHLNLD